MLRTARLGELTVAADLISDASAIEASGGRRKWAAHTVVRRIRCKVMPVQGRETWNSEMTISTQRFRVTTWYRPEIATTMRLKIGERMLDIVSVPVVEKRQGLVELECQEVT